MIHSAQRNGQLTGLVPHLIDKGVAVLQYADDTIVSEEARTMKMIMYLFESMSGLKINF